MTIVKEPTRTCSKCKEQTPIGAFHCVGCGEFQSQMSKAYKHELMSRSPITHYRCCSACHQLLDPIRRDEFEAQHKTGFGHCSLCGFPVLVRPIGA